jgi:6-aminohexanoate-oligomer endohydrolase
MSEWRLAAVVWLSLSLASAAVPRPAEGQRAAPDGPVPVPRADLDGPALEFDFPALHIGIAEYEEGPTGTTVFYFPEGVSAAVDVRGGAPGTIATDFLQLGYESSFIDAIVFSGGSSYGLAAATGVANELRDRRYRAGSNAIATVPGAIVLDVAPRRFNVVTPDEALGRAALQNARPGRFLLGARGAGRFTMQGAWFGEFAFRQHSGQGAAFTEVGPVKVAVFTVANPLGAIVDRAGNVVRCSNDPAAPPCGPASEYIAAALRRKEQYTRPAGAVGEDAEPEGPSQNTTLTLVVTNQKLDYWALRRLAVQVHTSMARAIQPFQTERDGDVLFAVSTQEVEHPGLIPVDLGVVASELAWDAVLSSVPPLPPAPREVVTLEGRVLDAYVGEYEFGPRTRLRIVREGDRLFAVAGERPIYSFGREERWELFPVSRTEFFSRNPRGDRIRFVEGARPGTVGLHLNPGPWQLSATRIP